MKVYSRGPPCLALVDIVSLQGKFDEDRAVYTLFIAVSQCLLYDGSPINI